MVESVTDAVSDDEVDERVENHRSTETHDTAQPPQPHDNEVHDRDFVDEGEAAAAAPVQSVNGETGDVEVDTGERIDKTVEAITFDEPGVNIVGSELASIDDELQISLSNFTTGPSTDFSPSTSGSNDEAGEYGARLSVDENIAGVRVPGTVLNTASYPITLELRVGGTTVDEQTLDDSSETAELTEPILAPASGVDVVADLDGNARRDTFLDLPRDVGGVVSVDAGIVEGSLESDEVALIQGIETLVPADSGAASVELPTPDVFSWNLASYQRRVENGSVDVFVEEDDGTGFTEIAGPITRNHEIQADDDSDVRLRVEIEGNSNDGTPALESAYIQYDV